MEEFDEILSGRAAVPEPLTDAYRVIRPLARAEHPVPAVLARGPDGPVALAAAGDLDGWPGWDMHGQHVLAPVDVVRTTDGHAVSLAWCRHRLTAEWAARAQSGGQAVTLAVSLMRGTLEARHGERGVAVGPPGTWWADDDARPLFAAAVPDDQGRDAQRRPGGSPSESARHDVGRRQRRAAHRGTGSAQACEGAAPGAAALLSIVADGMSDRVVRRLLDRAVALLADPTELARGVDALEAALFEACAPQPLDLSAPDDPEAHAPPAPAGLLRRFAPAALASEADDGRGRIRRNRGGAAPRQRLPHKPAGQVRPATALRTAGAEQRPAIGAVIGSAARSGAARVREGLRGRRAAYAVGGAAAAGVVLVGLVWPSGEPPAQADGPAPVDTPGAGAAEPEQEREAGARDGGDDTSASSGEGAEAESGGSADGGDGIDAEVSADPVEAAARLVTRAAACDDGCDGVFAEGAAAGPDAAPWSELEGSGVALIDDYGGVTLVKAGEGAGAHYLSLVLVEERWLLRDAYPAG